MVFYWEQHYGQETYKSYGHLGSSDSLLTKSYGRGCELWLHWLVSKVQFARVAKYSGFMLVTMWVSGFQFRVF